MREIGIGLLGLGTVGSGVVRLLQDNQAKISSITGRRLTIKRVIVRHPEKHRDTKLDGVPMTANIEDMIQDPAVQIVVEVMGTIQPAEDYIKRLLQAGKHVVTANKDLIAQKGGELVDIAARKQRDLMYEASVAGGIPILRTIVNSFAADQILEVSGIVNGTTNYILTQMNQKKVSYAAALKSAQDLGFAESDPTNDVMGIDAAYKMIILTQFAFGMSLKLENVTVEGIDKVRLEDIQQAQSLGYTIKLIGDAKEIDGKASVSVGPTLIANSNPLAAVQNENNAVVVKSAAVGNTMFYGPGAGELPTANSVVSDIIAVTKDIGIGITGNTFNSYRHQVAIAPNSAVKSAYYLALRVRDIPGQMLALTRIMAESKASFRQIFQTSSDGDFARVVMITHEISLAQLEKVQEKVAVLENIELISSYRVLD
ncbi:homoserine dehydrogenase [Loigolactobacillus backii]|uniref:homoserine dehydrogenase n=1 Tax=Loigolactobacillus backii TaxID=375175 RepID=UPI0007F119EF|nr:homoserine dehydrogenase [Loigolactobacillus backii]ANK59032.1 homoserine dehydrogenase [Loigolactobacillus backii]ANK64020.1 homoserine dehydrogenase [Loigolactobacillus backii]ANK66469.1 homoserine dehydrogenase [Loigolactobacillus backii]OLF69855.1 homoserine dehydrogenase [Loigolactobacillus backii]PIO84002.1 homoserine dehydrogenase [Loigolactobacillus backii]